MFHLTYLNAFSEQLEIKDSFLLQFVVQNIDPLTENFKIFIIAFITKI